AFPPVRRSRPVLRVLLHHRGHSRASIHHGRDGGAGDAGGAGGDVTARLDPAAGREEMAADPRADLSGGGSGRPALLLAGEGGYGTTPSLHGDRGGAVRAAAAVAGARER